MSQNDTESLGVSATSVPCSWTVKMKTALYILHYRYRITKHSAHLSLLSSGDGQDADVCSCMIIFYSPKW